MPQIYVDADACPVKDEIRRVAERHQIVAHLVSNRGFKTGEHPLIRNVLVGDKFDEADNWIVEHLVAGDIVVTGDIQLADRCLKAVHRQQHRRGAGDARAVVAAARHGRDQGRWAGVLAEGPHPVPECPGAGGAEGAASLVPRPLIRHPRAWHEDPQFARQRLLKLVDGRVKHDHDG
jgi:uncharacterized protein YaiI (UPF0178 family)